MAEALTPDEVAELKVGEVVSVTWSVGNGPHEYVACEVHEGAVYVATRYEIENVHPQQHDVDKPLRHVGLHPLTVVRRVEV